MYRDSNFVNNWLQIGQILGGQSGVGGPFLRSGLIPGHIFVNGQLGSDTNDGHDPRYPLLTIAAAVGNGSSSKARSGDVIHLIGNFTEEVTGYNLLEDITIIGESGRPRHADHARDYASYAFATVAQDEISGASWRSPSTAAGPLLIVRGQGWRVVNILFAVPTSYAGIRLERNALSDVSEYDASHFSVEGCRFAGGLDGINDSGGCFNVHVKDCIFHGQSGRAIETISTSVAVPLMWVVEDNQFINNAEHVYVSANHWTVRNNNFGYFSGTYSLNLKAVSAQGEYNNVYGNHFYGDYDGAYLAGANDSWPANFSADITSDEVGGSSSALNPLTTAVPAA